VTSNGGTVYALNAYGGTNAAVTIGGSGNQNIFSGMASSCLGTTCDSGFNVVASNGASFGTNTYMDPAFNNVSDLITNRNGVPNCSGFQLVTACMGWNASTATLTTPSTISDLLGTAIGSAPYYSMVAGKGFQLPSVSCAANSEYPAYLKGLVTLVASGFTTGATITEIPGNTSKPCNM
jgi:hypothetical protein